MHLTGWSLPYLSKALTLVAVSLIVGCGDAASKSTSDTGGTVGTGGAAGTGGITGTGGASGMAGEIARSDAPRVTAPQLPSGDLATLTAGNDAFAVDLYRTLRGSSGNMVFSPESISIALAMTYAGAAGDTAAQMASTLHFTLPPERLHLAFDALDLALEAPTSTAGAFQLSLANALWAQQGWTLQPSFLDLLSQDYGAGVRLVDFEGATETARQTINQWVSDQTAGQIPELLMDGILTPGSRLVLTNAIYFKADWLMPFNSPSNAGTFNTPDGPISVPMMAGQAVFPVWTGPGYSAAALPYVGGTASMLLIVPDAGTFDTFEASLTADALAAISAGRSAATGRGLLMPRFKFQQHFSVKQALQALGMTDAFEPQADFSGIDGKRDLLIADVVHQATIAADEKGTEAAAATAVIIRAGSAMQAPLVVDRPFIFLIRDDVSGATLFMGRVLDPSR